MFQCEYEWNCNDTYHKYRSVSVLNVNTRGKKINAAKYELQVNPLIGFRWENDSKGKQSEGRIFTDFMMMLMLLLNADDLFTLKDVARDEIRGF